MGIFDKAGEAAKVYEMAKSLGADGSGGKAADCGKGVQGAFGNDTEGRGGEGSKAKSQPDMGKLFQFADAKKRKEAVEKREQQAKTLGKGLNARLKFAHDLVEGKDVMALSAERPVSNFLQRLLVENPEMISANYYAHFLEFNETTSKTDIEAFIQEVKLFRDNSLVLKEVLSRNKVSRAYTKSLQYFSENMLKLIKAAEALTGLSNKDRTTLYGGLYGKETKLGGKQKKALALRAKVAKLQKKLRVIADRKSKGMKKEDLAVKAVLDRIAQEECLAENL